MRYESPYVPARRATIHGIAERKKLPERGRAGGLNFEENSERFIM